MADWEEIKRLAADFQKVQLSSTSQKSVFIIFQEFILRRKLQVVRAQLH
jgi:hypothetical protein